MQNEDKNYVIVILNGKERVLSKQRWEYILSMTSFFKIKYCPHCKSTNIVFEQSETYCADCGLVLQGTPPLWVNCSKIQYIYGLILG